MPNLDASSPQLKLVKNLFDAFTSFDLVNLACHLSKDFQYNALNGVADLAELDKEGYAGFIGGVFGGVTKLDVTFSEIIEAPGKVIVQGSISAQTASGATLPYDALAIISIKEEDGEPQVLSIKNFPDTQMHNTLMAFAAKAAAEKGSAS